MNALTVGTATALEDTALPQTGKLGQSGAAGAAKAPAADGYQAVAGLDPASKRLEREIEARAHQKVASDHAHLIWAYGIIWSLFVLYGWWLTRNARRLRADVQALRDRMDAADNPSGNS